MPRGEVESLNDRAVWPNDGLVTHLADWIFWRESQTRYKLPENTLPFLEAGIDDATREFTSYSSDAATVTPHLALVTWHSAGLQAIDLLVAPHPKQVGAFSPEPLPPVATEDPALSRGPGKVVMWGYPIVDRGLIYVVDIRNGLYIVRYTGPHADELDDLSSLQGDSNLGSAAAAALAARRGP